MGSCMVIFQGVLFLESFENLNTNEDMRVCIVLVQLRLLVQNLQVKL